ncbi:MAG: MFS transporter [Pyrinomonadaceae bacterium]
MANANAMTTPTLTSLASKSASGTEQGLVLGLTQSMSSLARIVGPLLGGYLVTSATAPQHIDDYSIRLTFWTAGAISLFAFFLSVYFARRTWLKASAPSGA